MRQALHGLPAQRAVPEPELPETVNIGAGLAPVVVPEDVSGEVVLERDFTDENDDLDDETAVILPEAL